MSKSYGVGVPTSHRGYYGPRLRHYFSNLLSSLFSPHVTTVFWVFSSPPPKPNSYIPSICHSSMPLHFSLLQPVLPPYSPRRGATVHLDVSHTHRPPLLISALPYLAVLYLLTISLLEPGVPRHVPVSAVSLVRSPPPFSALNLCIGPCQTLGVLPSVGPSLPPSAFLRRPPV